LDCIEHLPGAFYDDYPISLDARINLTHHDQLAMINFFHYVMHRGPHTLVLSHAHQTHRAAKLITAIDDIDEPLAENVHPVRQHDTRDLRVVTCCACGLPVVLTYGCRAKWRVGIGGSAFCLCVRL
jgi:hypothetical protein